MSSFKSPPPPPPPVDTSSNASVPSAQSHSSEPVNSTERLNAMSLDSHAKRRSSAGEVISTSVTTPASSNSVSNPFFPSSQSAIVNNSPNSPQVTPNMIPMMANPLLSRSSSSYRLSSTPNEGKNDTKTTVPSALANSIEGHLRVIQSTHLRGQ